MAHQIQYETQLSAPATPHSLMDAVYANSYDVEGVSSDGANAGQPSCRTHCRRLLTSPRMAEDKALVSAGCAVVGAWTSPGVVLPFADCTLLALA